MAAATHLAGERRSGLRGKKGRVVGLYANPLAGSTVICLDERGPVAARRYPLGGTWADAAHRPHFRPDYARGGYCWAYGALNHRSGAVLLETAETRDTASWLRFLDRLESFAPEGAVYLILDGLPLHWTVDTMLWNWGHPRFHFVALPKAAAWLNLIEPWWKILRSLALKGRRFESWEAIRAAVDRATAYWNAHRHHFHWGRRRRHRPRRKPGIALSANVRPT